MARIKLIFPEKNLGSISIPVRITDVNYGNHVGNDSIVSIIHEARVAWLAKHEMSEMNIGGSSIIMNELVVNYLQESFYGDVLDITIAVGEVSISGFELYYKLDCVREDKTITIAIARTCIRCFDYQLRKVCPVPETFLKIIQAG
jgi:acyl-CoA thioesterase FadM